MVLPVSAYGMEVTTPYALISRRSPKEEPYFSFAAWPCRMREWMNRPRFSELAGKRNHHHLLGGRNPFHLHQPNMLNIPDEPVFNSRPLDMSGYNPWKTNVDSSRFTDIFRVIPEELCDTECHKSMGSIRKIAARVCSVFYVKYLCKVLIALFTAYKTHILKNQINIVTIMSKNIGPKNKLAIQEASPILYQDKKIKPEVSGGGSNSRGAKETAIMSCIHQDNTLTVELHCGVKNSRVDKEMISRKQRQLNKQSKKRRRRIKKKNKISTYSLGKKGRSAQNKVHFVEPGRIKSASEQLPNSRAARSKTIFNDWDDSDEDLFIVFDDGIDNDCNVSHENHSTQCAEIEETDDLWIEFDSLTLVSDNSGLSVDSKVDTSEILFQCDSDSEYEEDTGQIFVSTSEFDSYSGLFVVGHGQASCSSFQTGVQHASFVSGSFFHNFPSVSYDSEIYQVNKRWAEMTLHIDDKPRTPQQVTFAPENDLTVIFPVDMIDRKGEWEQYALARCRFKRRVEEFEKLISPYLTAAYRDSVFRRMSAAS